MKHTSFSLDYFSKDKPVNNHEYILVTGAAGYIGQHLIKILMLQNYKVKIYDNFTFENKLKFESDFPDIEIIEGDINDPIRLASAMKDVSVVIALAAIVGDPACSVNFLNTYNVNYISTRILVDLANYHNIKRIVFASSCSVYGESLGNEFLNETSDLNPVSSYAYSRIVSENYLRDHCLCEFVILRLATVYGLSNRMRYDLVVNLLSAKSYFNKKAFIFGGDQWRPFVHCSDAANAFFIAATTDKNINAQIFNVGSTSENYQLKDLKSIIESFVSGAEIILEENVTDNRNYKVDFTKIESTLNFKIKINILSGISEMINFFELSGGVNISEKHYSNYLTFLELEKNRT